MISRSLFLGKVVSDKNQLGRDQTSIYPPQYINDRVSLFERWAVVAVPKIAFVGRYFAVVFSRVQGTKLHSRISILTGEGNDAFACEEAPKIR